MDEIRICSYDYNQRQPSVNASRGYIIQQANNLFNQARSAASLEKMKAFLLGHSPELFDLAQIPGSALRGSHYGGIQGIDISEIKGTMGRENDFDHHFQPLDDRHRDRWLSIAMARRMNIPLKPIEVIQVRDVYFVKDGHHRVSVAKAMNESFIDAEVIVWDVVGRLPWDRSSSNREFSHAL